MFRKQVIKLLGLLWKFNNVLPRTFKLFVRPHHEHGHIIYDEA